jgi:flagellar assembly protein FliH
MPEPARFTFDLDLGSRDEVNITLSVPEFEAQLAAARAEGRASGFAEGEQSALVRAAETLAGEAHTIATHAGTLLGQIDAERGAMTADAVQLASTIARKLAHRLIAQFPLVEIGGLVEDALASLVNAPHLVIRCAPEFADDVRDVASAAIATSSFTGRLVVLGDPALGVGDARIEWADGGVTRDSARLDAELDTRLAEFLSAHSPAPTPKEA